MTRSNCHRTGGPAAQTDPLAALGGSLLWSGLVALANTRVSKKVEVNSKTRPEIERATLRFRVDVAREHHLAMYCDRLFDLQRDLNRAWSLPEPQHRKRRVFALFDDANGRFPVPGARVPAMAMADLGSMRNEAITAARRLVVLFVNARFPKGSRHGYSRRELRALNRARKGSVAFSPYAASPG